MQLILMSAKIYLSFLFFPWENYLSDKTLSFTAQKIISTVEIFGKFHFKNTSVEYYVFHILYS